jgi:hypothetical protein
LLEFYCSYTCFIMFISTTTRSWGCTSLVTFWYSAYQLRSVSWTWYGSGRLWEG